MKHLSVTIAALASALVILISPAWAQSTYVFYSDGIQGGAVKSGAEGGSEVLGYLHETSLPIDAQTGRPRGAVQHMPIHFTKVVDTASPALTESNVTGKLIEKLLFQFRTIAPTGAEEVFFTVEIEDVIVSRVATFLANPDDLAQLPMPDTPLLGSVALETVSVTYGRIVWRHEEGYEFEDEWTSAPSGKTDDQINASELAVSVFPNPFNAVATLSIDLGSIPQGGDVEVSIYDALGRQVALDRLDATSGTQRYVWDATDTAGRDVPSGLYFYRIRTGEAVASGGMTLVK